MAELPEGVTPLSAWRRLCLCATPPHPGVVAEESPPAPEPHSEPEPESEPEESRDFDAEYWRLQEH